MTNKITKRSIELEKIILNIIHELKVASRTTINKISGIRLSTITDITKKLIDEKVIIETGSIPDMASKYGKKDLLINANFGNIIGIDVQPNYVFTILTDFCGKTLLNKKVPIYTSSTKDEILNVIYASLDDIIESSSDKIILGIGVSTMGIINPKTERIILSSHANNWNDVPLKKLLKERYPYPIFQSDRVIAQLYAEKWFGTVHTKQTAVFIEMGKTFGASIMYNGQILKNSTGVLGEVGHFCVSTDNKLCTCGNSGCLQTVASANTIIKSISSAIRDGAISVLKDSLNGDLSAITIPLILEAASKGDRICINVLSQAAYYIGKATSYIINLLGPELVIFGGDMITDSDFFINMIIDEVKKESLYLTLSDIHFKKSEYGLEGGALGAICLVLEDYYDYSYVVNQRFTEKLSSYKTQNN